MSFSSVRVFGEKASPNKVYYNASVLNNSVDTTINVRDPSVVYVDTRQSAIIPDVSKYSVSVENFTINGATKNLPIFIPQIAPIADLQIIALSSDGTGVTTFYIDDTNGQDVTFTCEPGDYINEVSGLPEGYNFSTPKLITATTSNSIQVDDFISPAEPLEQGLSGRMLVQNSRNPDYTIYTVSVGIYKGGGYNLGTQAIIWEPENKAPFIGKPRRTTPQIDSEYYYCYSYNHWIGLVNKALFAAWGIAGGSSAGGTQCPFFTFNPTSGLFTLCQDANTCMVPYGNNLPYPWNISSAAGYVEDEYSFVGMNTNLEGMLTNWQVIYYSYNAVLWSSQPNKYLPEIVFNFGMSNFERNLNQLTGNSKASSTYIQNNTQFLTNPFTNTDLATSYLCLQQEYVSTGTLWSPVASIVIATTKIPVRSEFTTLPFPLGDQNIGSQNASSGATQKVLIETPINAVTADIWRGWILYQPLTPTYSSMEDSQISLSELDFYAYWRNRLTGNLIPLRLYNSGTFTIRLLFDKL